jgi:hypothetical protein
MRVLDRGPIPPSGNSLNVSDNWRGWQIEAQENSVRIGFLLLYVTGMMLKI